MQRTACSCAHVLFWLFIAGVQSLPVALPGLRLSEPLSTGTWSALNWMSVSMPS